MSAATRYATLDAVRGVAVMGILLANIIAFGLPEAAYFSPLAWGGSTGANRVAWFLNFVFVEGRMRGLFSFLFGASMLLVIERAEAAGRSGAATHLARMAVLFAIGCAHLYLFWWGDILAHYALVGAITLLFARLSTRALIACALGFLALSILYNAAGAAALFASMARATPEQVATYDSIVAGFGVPPRAVLLEEITAMRGTFADAVRWRWEHAISPFTFLWLGGAETVSAVLLGMAGYRSGFVTGAWPARRYAAIAAIAITLSLTGYVAVGLHTIARDFAVQWVFLGALVLSAPFRMIGFIGYAALLVLVIRRGGAMVRRLEATGRMAFSNYLLTTLVMDLVFCGWGLGLFAQLDRATLYLLVPPVWVAMLWWSPWWLGRFAYGPFEWLWRSLARARAQPMRRPA